MKPDAQWFCFLAVEQGILTPDDCAQLLRKIGTDVDVLVLAQTVVDTDSSGDIATIQAVLDEAYQRGQKGERPPAIDSDRSAGTVPEEPLPPDAAQAHVATHKGLSRNFEIKIRKDDLVTADLNAIADLDDEVAADVMRALLAAVRSYGGSDLHLSAGAFAFMRVFGRIGCLGDTVLTRAAAEKLNMALLDPSRRDKFAEARDMSLAIQLPDGNRYRTNLILHKQGVAGTYHVVPNRIPSLKELGFEEDGVLRNLLDHRNGLIVVAGPVGCGKTTTLAALVDVINNSRDEHVITIEDPIEILHQPNRCLITQREVGLHTRSYVTALKGALREDPDVIVVGELHDLETTEMAMTAAETGHLVIGTLHTQDAATTLNRLLDVFPPSQQPQIRAMASGSLRGIVCQRLLARTDQEGQVAAYEVLLNTNAVAKIIRDGTTHHLPTVMQTGVSQGMRAMDQSVLSLFERGLISREVALQNLTSKTAVRKLQAELRGAA